MATIFIRSQVGRSGPRQRDSKLTRRFIRESNEDINRILQRSRSELYRDYLVAVEEACRTQIVQPDSNEA
jgi:hypothetical protein